MTDESASFNDTAQQHNMLSNTKKQLELSWMIYLMAVSSKTDNELTQKIFNKNSFIINSVIIASK